MERTGTDHPSGGTDAGDLPAIPVYHETVPDPFPVGIDPDGFDRDLPDLAGPRFMEAFDPDAAPSE